MQSTLRSDGTLWTVVGVALLALGLLVRVALYFPLAMFQIDSDAVLAGLCAFRIAAGHVPAFFPGGTRLSAASCYVAAGYFHLLGPGRVGLALTGLTWATLYLIFSLLFLRATLGPKMACLAFIFAAFPSEQFMTVTYAPWGYGEIMASCAATLWLASRWRSDGALWHRLCFGFSVGIGIWFSLQTLMIAVPAVVWIASKRRAHVAGEALPAFVAAVVGAAPFWLSNLANNFASLNANWASRPAPGIAQVFDNLRWLLTYMLPKLLFRSSGWWSETTVLMVAYAIIAVGFIFALRRNGSAAERNDATRDLAVLLSLVFASCVLFFSLSNAGSLRGWTVRYIAPLYIVVPLFCAIGLKELWRRTKLASVVVVFALLIPNLLLYGLPGSPQRAGLTVELSNDERIRGVLSEHHVQLVYGDYFWVYHLNFDTRERVAAVPSVPVFDYFEYGNRFGTSPVRWALLGGLDEVRRLAKAQGASGELVPDGDLWLLISKRAAPNAAALLHGLWLHS